MKRFFFSLAIVLMAITVNAKTPKDVKYVFTEASELNIIGKIQKVHPDIPLIFQQTIYRERRNFDLKTDANERAKQEMAEKLMKEACKKYKNVYFIQPNATDELHETSVDGTHPGDLGYTLWAKSTQKPLLKILKKYGIK